MWVAPSLSASAVARHRPAQGATPEVTYEEYKTDALGNRLWVRDPGMEATIDRSKYYTFMPQTGQLTQSGLGTAGCGTPGATWYSCHPPWYYYEYFQTHDQAGNVDETWGLDTPVETQTSVPDESRSYYAADDKLTYYNRFLGSHTLPGAPTGAFEDYRYDALGRRVLTRTRRPSSCGSPCEAYVQRTVWDGDQVLYEIRSSGKDGVSPTYMESEGVSVAPGDHANLYGVVAYAHAQGIDQPVGILKRYAEEGTWGYVTPHANWKGEWSYGTFSDGSICLTMGQSCPNWPGFSWSMDGASRGTEPQSYTVWWGSIIRGQADASGLQYLRNRYYDPRTGRFTQQDPIGLAGGMNLYGFAAGDPVNYSDPFGLCPPKDRNNGPECKRVVFAGISGSAILGAGGSGGLGVIVWSGKGPGLYLRGGGGFGGSIGGGGELGTSTNLYAFRKWGNGAALSVFGAGGSYAHNEDGNTYAGTLGPRVNPEAALLPVSMNVERSYMFALTAGDGADAAKRQSELLRERVVQLMREAFAALNRAAPAR